MKFQIIHKDPSIVVVHKDAGLLTTPAHGEVSLLDHLNEKLFGPHMLKPVHRLDRQTSGLLVFARDPISAECLARQFSGHRVEREYVAICQGSLRQASGSIRSPVQGKRAATHYVVVEKQPQATTVRVRLETGRRNQIRVHFADLGHPLLGDKRFSNNYLTSPDRLFSRIALHAFRLGFIHPSKKVVMRFHHPPPDSFFHLLAATNCNEDPHSANICSQVRRRLEVDH